MMVALVTSGGRRDSKNDLSLLDGAILRAVVHDDAVKRQRRGSGRGVEGVLDIGFMIERRHDDGELRLGRVQRRVIDELGRLAQTDEEPDG